MADTADQASNADQSVNASDTPKASKDRNCPYCGQAFTSSSLGRHLDLYIKERNPKPPDGIHDVDGIRKLRASITRRQPRGSLKRDDSTPTRTSAGESRKSPTSDDAASSRVKSPTSAQLQEGFGRQYPFNTPWEATGVINDITSKVTSASDTGRSEGDSATSSAPPVVPPPRAVSRQMMKAQMDMKQKIQDATDTARAAELALRELLSSWRAAKLHMDMNSMPFDFEPLSLDFPALCLQCLEPPPTLYSSTQHPTATSWSILPPGEKQFAALQKYFAEEFEKWKITCAAATTSYTEDLTYPPSATMWKPDVIKDAVWRAEKAAETLEKRVTDHLESMFTVWQQLEEKQRQGYWTLELARGVGRKQKEIDAGKATNQVLKQENENLKTQIEHLNRLQQPREYKITPPATVYMPQGVIDFFHVQGVVKQRSGVGMTLKDRHSDLNTVVATAIERWKHVIVSTRTTSGLPAQRSLDARAAEQEGEGESSGSQGHAAPTPQPQTQGQQHAAPPLQTPHPRRPAANMMNGSLGTAFATSAAAPGISGTNHRPPSIAPTMDGISVDAADSVDAVECMSDEDADGDAEMDDDDDADHGSMHTPTAGGSLKTGRLQNASSARMHDSRESPRARRALPPRLANVGVKNAKQGGPEARGPARAARPPALQNSGGGEPMYLD